MAGRRERQNQNARAAFAARAAQTTTTEDETASVPARPAASGSSAAPQRARPTSATASAQVSPEGGEHADKPGGKGRPTPKRREAEAANRRPIVVTDRKAARKQERAAREAAYQRQQEGIARGDERFFLPRDRGPARAFVRDVVDARWNIGELMLPVAVVVLLVMFLQGLFPDIVAVVVLVTYFVLLAGIVDSVAVGLLTKRKAVKKFGADEVPKWTGWYAGMRALQVRRLRQPKPRVSRGAKID